MPEATFYWIVLACWLGFALLTVPVLMWISAPYGRHMREGWGPRIPRWLGWVLMESPALWVFALAASLGVAAGPSLSSTSASPRWQSTPTLLLSGMYLGHYVYRALIYPFRLRGGNALMPASVAGFALLFNLVNGYLQGRWLHVLGPVYPDGWLGDPRFLIGASLWAIGLAINLHADEVLLRLRKPGERGYTIPNGGLYRFVSCPNYLGELVEWSGYALACWSLPGAAFAIWVAANLLPRARAHHAWYHETFGDGYPAERRAVIPFLL
ncbi:MAG: 3-oxo-5-alpha-steroid 4-dehydrogenase [Deltaproteobacteria bacterium]|nr:MAG: 3-oxo-5-alpha-steroid 4-dehydrogenase [Deltaproteobacteria bacterium]